MAAIIGMHHLQRTHPGPVKFDGDLQVRRRIGHLDDLDYRATNVPSRGSNAAPAACSGSACHLLPAGAASLPADEPRLIK